MYKAIVWDLDGTVLDTLYDLWASVNAALAAHGMPARSYEEIRAFLGNGMQNLLSRSVPEGTSEEMLTQVLETYVPYYKAHMEDHTAPYPGVLAMLDTLKARSVKLALVSNKADIHTKGLVKKYFGDRMTVAVGAREGVPIKPAPDAVFAALSEMGVDPSEAVFVGDTEVDVATGLNAGMDVFAVSWGFRSEEQLRAAGAERIYGDAQSLLAALLAE